MDRQGAREGAGTHTGRAPVTLAQIARQAGVHVSTVSRALSPDESVRGGVATDTATVIRALAEELGYQRDPAGAALRTGRSRMLGVLVPRLTDIVLATIYEGIDAAAAAAGYHTVVANTGDDPELQRRRADALLARRVDGLVLGDARSDSDLVAELARQHIPLVLVSRRLPGRISVTTDDVLGGRLAAEHLLELGHRRVAVVAGEPYASTGAERTQGFLDAYAEAGLPVPESHVVRSRFDVPGGRAAAERLLALRPRPTAVFAVNDFAAIGVMAAVRDAGLTVGRDVAIVGYNDVPLAAALPVSLTSVSSPMYRMGEVAATTLVNMLNGKPGRSRRLRPALMARTSTLGGTPLTPEG
ncbi:LacI family DNA-binding transcriptional regulator [Streptomyces sp. 6-11-2]|uniref:LacI family DNA-binding transcriptional regulator n=1 Tax=Streptomyces sp. 6-11-2 TaxID=2585753 RepID=UPI00114192D4|nr:substrate-binding domain-containing protein [Streptomyces sp. 6-11-2]GED84218.1 LacI family transcriptional regulator [Streptomyces sp. 6-11-2]